MDKDHPKIKAWLERPTDFAYSGELPIGETWTLGPMIETRDSDLVSASNSYAIRDALAKRPDLEGDWEITNCSHWLAGWVDHLSFRVLSDDGEVNGPMVDFWMEIESALQDYPLLDEDDYSRREDEWVREVIQDSLAWVLRGYEVELSDELVSSVQRWFREHNEEIFEGHTPGDGRYREALAGLGYQLEEEL